MGDAPDVQIPSQVRRFMASGAYPASAWLWSQDAASPTLTGSRPSHRPRYPPPASVEDEADSLAREFNASSSSSRSDEEPPSRGEIEQHPILLEVHEYNPERRFVILDNTSTAPAGAAQTRPSAAKSPKATGADDVEKPKADAGRRHEPAPPSAQGAKPGLERRRSRQHLAPLDTKGLHHHYPEHRRSRSSAMADAPRPDFFSPRQSRRFEDQLLSPDIITSGTVGRDKAYHEMGKYAITGDRLPTRLYQVEQGERNKAEPRHRRTRTSSTARRFDSGAYTTQPSNRVSGDWEAESRRQKNYSTSPRSTAREEHSAFSRRSEGEDVRTTPTGASRSQSRSSNGPAKDTTKDKYAYTYTHKSPVVFQDGHRISASVEQDGGDGGKARSRSRMNTAPLPSADRGPSPAATPTTPRSAATFPSADGGRRRPQGAQLPYPDDDDDDVVALAGVGAEKRNASSSGKTMMPSPVVVMPEPLSATVEQSARTRGPASPVDSCRETPQDWPPSPFDPEKTAFNTERPAGTYRRYSESQDKDGSGGLPDCPRTEPVAGMVDWLTLTRTNFNICPTCYGAVFAQTEFRTHFKPILRPTDEAIACDFGSSPWYRIAWLLTLKHEKPDLRLLYRVADVAASSRNGLCPGDRKATRNWLTVNDAHTRRPVSEFAICCQCAMTVEALLPNLSGLFVPSASQSRPTRDVCALHFTPKRKQFVQYFDALETTSDMAFVADKAPDVAGLAHELRRLSIGRACRGDIPVHNGYWHLMQSLPELTVCGACFDEAVRPRLEEGNSVAQNFFVKPQRLSVATCQLYSARMREVFQKACRRRDRDYLEAKVLERRGIETDVYEKLRKLDRAQKDDAWSEKQAGRLVEEWRRWE